MGKKIVVNGSFDILHKGHVELLNYAKSLGNFLLVLTDSDERIRQLKGETRPVNCLADRMFMLKNLKAVDYVMSFGSADELEELIRDYQPDIMVKGSDYKGKPIVGSQYCKEIVFLDLVDGYSTTKIIQSIANR